MFILNSESIGESISFGRSEANSIREELNSTERGDVILFGSPQTRYT